MAGLYRESFRQAYADESINLFAGGVNYNWLLKADMSTRFDFPLYKESDRWDFAADL